jgi:antitoxin ParD1/3/4
MAIQLRPELEEIIREDVRRGPYTSADEYLERAVTMLHEQENWLAAHRDEIAARIEEGLASVERGELADAEQVQARMRTRKQEWAEKRKSRRV